MATQSFEEALKKLAQIVEELESGDQPLEKALNKFEEGIGLAKFCDRKLNETEARVNQLMQNEEIEE
jgi:exodeoxyribonuclease VII small subunit